MRIQQRRHLFAQDRLAVPHIDRQGKVGGEVRQHRLSLLASWPKALGGSTREQADTENCL